MTTGKLFGLALLGSAPLITTTALADPVADGGKKFRTTLTGAAEVPGPGDPDGAGTASVTVNAGQKRVCYELEVRNLDPVTAAHIHIGSSTQAGPISVTLDPPTDGDSSGCVDVTRELADAIRKAPQAYYVNVHTTVFPAGAVRGQLK